MPFRDFLGNPHCVGLLQRALRSGRVSHALLFCGPEAIGKRLLARHLASALNCQQSDDDWCGHCKECRLIQLGHHPDVRTLEPDGAFIKIEQVRDLIHQAVFQPFQGRCKVFIVDEADRLKLEAGNALLKILEEPPPTSKIVLVTSKPHALLATVQSRCQMLRFAPLQKSEIEKILLGLRSMDSAEAARRADLAEGSIGRAMALDLERHELLSTAAHSFLELATQGKPLGLASQLVASVCQERQDTEDWLKQLLCAIRRNVLSRVLEGKREVENVLSLSQMTAMAHSGEALRRSLEHNVNRVLAVESLFLEFRRIAGHG